MFLEELRRWYRDASGVERSDKVRVEAGAISFAHRGGGSLLDVHLRVVAADGVWRCAISSLTDVALAPLLVEIAAWCRAHAPRLTHRRSAPGRLMGPMAGVTTIHATSRAAVATFARTIIEYVRYHYCGGSLRLASIA